MQANNLSSAAADLIESCGNTVKNMIDAYRSGGERAVVFLEQHWSNALQEPNAPLNSSEVVKNAFSAQRALNTAYIQGLAQSSKGAQETVNQIINLANQGVEQIAANASMFEERTGLPTFSLLSRMTLPGAMMLVTSAAQIEQKTANLFSRFAHDDVSTTTIKRTSSYSQKRPTKPD